MRVKDLCVCHHVKGKYIYPLVGRVFANGTLDLGSIPGHVIAKTLKIVLDTSFA